MHTKHFLLSTLLSSLLLTTNTFAQTIECKNGKCFIKLSQLAPKKNGSIKVDSFKKHKIKELSIASTLYTIEPPAIQMEQTENKAETLPSNNLEIVAFDHSVYIAQANEEIEPDNEIETIVLEPSSYIMSQSEINEFYKNGHRMEEEADTLLIAMDKKSNRQIEEKIIEKTKLPTSDYYCKNNKKAVYNQKSKTYQCTI